MKNKKEIRIPLFTYESTTGVIDIFYNVGDILFVTTATVEANSPLVQSSEEMVTQIRGTGKKLRYVKDLHADEIGRLLSFVDGVLQSEDCNYVNRYEQLYDILKDELSQKKER